MTLTHQRSLFRLLILYTLVVSRGQQERERAKSMCSVDRPRLDDYNGEEKDDANPNQKEIVK